jgi:hypothetical protein
MTVLEQLVMAVAADPEWDEMVPRQAENDLDRLTCAEWSRKGGSHYKDGQFTKK